MPRPETELRDLFISLFATTDDIHNFIWGHYSAPFVSALNPDSAPLKYSTELVKRLKGSGHINDTLFNNLRDERKLRATDINRTQNLFAAAAAATPPRAAPVTASASTPAAPEPAASTGDPLTDDLIDNLRRKRVLFIVGAGVSIGATDRDPVASWEGLLEHGVRHCQSLGRRDARWVRRRLEDLEEGDADDWITVAEQVTQQLGGPDGGQLQRWLSETVGKLVAQDTSVIDALHAFGCPIATTNYDGLLTGKPILWTNSYQVDEWQRGDREGVLHLHGHYETARSVVLGARSYWEQGADERAQAVQKALLLSHTLVFVGCGAGLKDPNIGALLEWAKLHLKGVGARHYRLCRNAELSALQAEHAGSSIFPLPYGDHSDLGRYLTDLHTRAGGDDSDQEED